MVVKKIHQSSVRHKKTFNRVKITGTGEEDMEMVAFPLIPKPIEVNYRACTIPYRFPSDNPKIATPTEISWVNVFANSIPSFKFLLSSSF